MSTQSRREQQMSEAQKPGKGRVRILDKNTINQIAAGEVIERPASVVKELVENAIDAGADRIIVRVEEGGKKRIEIEDNGCGMSREDAVLAFEKHATSKITRIEDLDSVMSLGFRGEALPSIASVAKVELSTRQQKAPEEEGVLIRIEGGERKELKAIARSAGTKIVVRELFFNVPARRNYLKTPRTELNRVMDILTRYALYHGGIAFQLFSDGNRLMNSPKSQSLLANIGAIYGKDTAKEFIEVDHEKNFLTLKGYVSKPAITRASRAHQYLFVNGRFVKSEVVYKGIRIAYGNLLPKERYPLAVLIMQLDPGKVDVNVHPTKEEVRFSDEHLILEAVINAVRHQLHRHQLVKDASSVGEAMGREEVQMPARPPKSLPASEDFATGKELLEQKKQRFKLDPGQTETPGPFKGPAVEEGRGDYGPRPSAGKEGAHSLRPGLQRQLSLDVGAGEEAEMRERARKPAPKPRFTGEEKIPEMRAVGQVFDLYILAQGTHSLYIIDQHAVHEKMVYERLRKEVEERSQGSKQQLIKAVSFQCSPTEEALVKEQLPLLSKLGFEMDYFGKNTFLVKAVPSVLGQAVEKELVFDIIEELLDKHKAKKVVDALDDTIKTIACHSAIRKGRVLSLEEMNRIIAQLHDSQNPYACPHGRPTIISISVEELEKRFKRR